MRITLNSAVFLAAVLDFYMYKVFQEWFDRNDEDGDVWKFNPRRRLFPD